MREITVETHASLPLIRPLVSLKDGVKEFTTERMIPSISEGAEAEVVFFGNRRYKHRARHSRQL